MDQNLKKLLLSIFYALLLLIGGATILAKINEGIDARQEEMRLIKAQPETTPSNQ